MKSLRKVYGFMDNVKNDTYFANKIRDDLIFIVNYTKNIDEEELSKNEILLDYGSVDLDIVYSTLKDDIPELLKTIKTDKGSNNG